MTDDFSQILQRISQLENEMEQLRNDFQQRSHSLESELAMLSQQMRDIADANATAGDATIENAALASQPP